MIELLPTPQAGAGLGEVPPTGKAAPFGGLSEREVLERRAGGRGDAHVRNN